MPHGSLIFNGIDVTTGGYLTPPMPAATLAKLARGDRPSSGHLHELEGWLSHTREATLGPKEGVDPKDLAQAGWGVIFAHDAEPAVREALAELLELRRAQAASRHEHYYREFFAGHGYRPGESKLDFLQRHGVGPGPADPETVPYYLLIVGDPESIPFSFQYQLDIQYAVGRIHFDTLDEYAQYAHGVAAAEGGEYARPASCAFFGTCNAGDRATALSSSELVLPLADAIRDARPGCSVDAVSPRDATKGRLQALMGGDDTPSLLLSASHGVGFPSGDARQRGDQGALLCGDWPGPDAWRGEIPETFYFAADDVDDAARVGGLMAFAFACYGAGTPRTDDFARRMGTSPGPTASRAFVARLPQRLLAHPNGGALAFIGHVDRAWGYSFEWPGAKRQLGTFEGALLRLLDGHPVGSALEYFNERYAELAADLHTAVEDIEAGKKPDPWLLSGLWTARNDARNYVLIGDPAARLCVSADGESSSRQPAEARAAATAEDHPPLLAPDGQADPRESLTDVPGRAASAPSTAPSPEPDHGLQEIRRQAHAELSGALGRLSHDLGKRLENAMSGVASVEVATYVSPDLDEVEFDIDRGRFTGSAKLRMVTRMSVDGDTAVCVPERPEDLDDDLWRIHTDMLERAQEHRTRLLAATVSSARALLDVLE